MDKEPMIGITSEDISQAEDKRKIEVEIKSQIDRDDNLELAWDLEKGIDPIKSWQERNDGSLTSRIVKQYEEMYMVRDWISTGGLFTHYQRMDKYDPTKRMFMRKTGGMVNGLPAEIFDDFTQALSNFSQLNLEEMKVLIQSFNREYQRVGSKITQMINPQNYPEITPQVQEEYLGELQSIRNNQDYAIFFKSHFLQTYLEKFIKLGLMKP